MKKTTLLFPILLALASWLVAQPNPQSQAAQDAPSNTTCSFNYSSGAGNTLTSYCLSVNGNIVQFTSPAAYELIATGVVVEGYGVCDLNGGGTSDDVAYFDYANTDSGNWGATVVSALTPTTRKFVRTTADGICELTQTIKQIKANATGAGSVKITMALKNLSGIPRPARVMRVADVDAGADFNDDEFVAERNSSWGADPIDFGLLLTTNTFGSSQGGLVQTVFFGPDPCDYIGNLADAPFVGDGSILHVYFLGTINPGASKSVVMTYRPI